MNYRFLGCTGLKVSELYPHATLAGWAKRR